MYHLYPLQLQLIFLRLLSLPLIFEELLNLVTAIDHGPDVLLIDDGFSFLSEKNKIEYVDMLRDWVQISGSIIIWTTSLIEDLKYGDKNIINENKKGVIKLQSSLQSTDADVLKQIKRKKDLKEKNSQCHFL